MGKLITSFFAIALLALASLVAPSSYAASNSYVSNKYDTDYVECSYVAEAKSQKFSDAMYLGMFYGCMQERGHDPSNIS